ncbi:MAG: hypothetical protein EXS37_15145 [Opitutus sp.]|nr:hypothetical protein [Opitutus sp.]
MSTPRKRGRTKSAETDLFGLPLRGEPLRKVCRRPDRDAWCVAVREPAGTAHRYLGVFDSEGEAWQAYHDGLGAPVREDREEMRLEVRFSVRRGLR